MNKTRFPFLTTTVLRLYWMTLLLLLSVSISLWSQLPVAVEPEIAVTGKGQNIADGGTNSPALTNGTDYGTVDEATGMVTQTFTILNTGNGNLNLGSKAFSPISIGGTNPGDFVITKNPLGTIVPNGSTTFQITFNPSALGLRSATVAIINNDADENPFNFNIQGVGANITIDFASNNRLLFSDPCRCDAPRNCVFNNTTYFQDTLTVTTGGVSGLDIRTLGGATNFFNSVPCFRGGATPGLIPANTQIPESPVGSGVYKIEFWRPSGSTPTLSVTESGNTHIVPSAIFQPVCTEMACTIEPIPTMSQWGLILFGLMMVNMGLIFLRRLDLVH